MTERQCARPPKATRTLIRITSFLLVTATILMLMETPTFAVSAIQEETAPQQCNVEPRPLANILAIPTLESDDDSVVPPSAVPDGDSAEAETVVAITELVVQAIACANTNDPLRWLALTSDRYVADLFSGPDAVEPLFFEELVSDEPTPSADADWLTLVAIGEVVIVDGGRTAAVVTTENATDQFEDVLFFVEIGDAWLIDEAVPVIRAGLGTPAP